jgi:enamine deaminase RidA (YjgF/YER057c/UK114 family)
MMFPRRILFLLAGVSWLALAQMPEVKMRKPKKEKPEITQTLEALPEPPPFVKVESSRLVFFTSPLSNKGLLSQQIKDALTAIRRQAKGATIVKLRGFVAGRGDARRLASATSELFSEWRQPLPAVSVLQVGALLMEGAQVLIEAIAEDRKPVNMNGVDFLDGLETLRSLDESGEVASVAPLLERTLSQIAGDVVQLTCFVSALDEAPKLDAMIAAKFPQAARSLVQAQRATGSGLARCEAVRRRTRGEAERLILTATQIGFGSEPKDREQLESRLSRLLEAQNASALNRKAYAVARGIGRGLNNLTIVEGVGTNEAVLALEAVAVAKN